MALHLLKMCVGVTDAEDLRRHLESRRTREGGAADWRHIHVTRNMPRRADAVLDGGSLYWVMKGHIRARQRILALEPVMDGEGRRRCAIHLDPVVVDTVLKPCRPMQGWRYLEDGDAPPDGGAGDDAMPEEMAAELRALGLI